MLPHFQNTAKGKFLNSQKFANLPHIQYIQYMKLTLLRLLAFTLAGFFVSASYGQRIDSMMMEYAEKLPVEKIHIHFDKTVYNRTETVWYKVYILQVKLSPSAKMFTSNGTIRMAN
jgi:hypothetical protein